MLLGCTSATYPGAHCGGPDGTEPHTMRHAGASGLMTTNRRFPPPWSIEDIGAAYVVKDSLVIGFFDPGDRDAIEFGVSHQPALLAGLQYHATELRIVSGTTTKMAIDFSFIVARLLTNRGAPEVAVRWSMSNVYFGGDYPIFDGVPKSTRRVQRGR
jgi:hypothetical protein